MKAFEPKWVNSDYISYGGGLKEYCDTALFGAAYVKLRYIKIPYDNEQFY